MSEQQKEAVDRIALAMADVPEEHQALVADMLTGYIGAMAVAITASQSKE